MDLLSDVGTSEDAHRPSFFELAAQEQLRDLLQPVVRYLLSVLATRYPRYALRFSNRHEETYAAIMFFVERHYLEQWSGSFAENFYGMKRRRRPGVSSERAQSAIDLFTDHEKLRKREIRWSLLFLVGIPYLRSKADDLYETLGGGTSEDLFRDNHASRDERLLEENPSRGRRLKRRAQALFKKLWPMFTKAYELVLLAYNVGYLFDKTPYYRPWLHWLGIDIRRMDQEDYRRANTAQESLRASIFAKVGPQGRKPGMVQILLRALRLSPKLFLEALKVILPTSIFFFKFLEWWYSSSYARSSMSGTRSDDGATPAIRAPRQKLLPHPDGVLGAGGTDAEPLIKPGTCPVCKNPTTNPTALPTGWVGDYKCLYDYVSREGRCPVTRIACSTGDLRKING